jgi:hypothetical protein
MSPDDTTTPPTPSPDSFFASDHLQQNLRRRTVLGGVQSDPRTQGIAFPMHSDRQAGDQRPRIVRREEWLSAPVKGEPATSRK